jgi:hypothetical protein
MQRSMRLRLAFLSAAALGLSACATLNETECRSVDWYDLGVRDGNSGYTPGRLDEHRDACAEYGLGPDARAWRNGYETGLLDYCVADNGYRVGRRGGHYNDVCPRESEREFLSAFELGRETYQVEQELATLDRRIDSLETRLSGDKIDDELRRDLRRQVSDLHQQRLWLRRSVDRLESEWRRRY